MNPWRIPHVVMRIELDPVRVRTTTTITATRTRKGDDALFLHGSGLTLESLRVDGIDVAEHSDMMSADGLRVPLTSDTSVLEYVTSAPTVVPGQSGFVAQPRLLSTQCEPEGFRCLTFFIDEPSNRAVFDVTLVGDVSTYPVMIAAGELLDSGELDDGRHFVHYVDPVQKPSYLFALVAGELAESSRRYVTSSGRTLNLTVVALPEFIDGADFALATLEQAMRRDEDELESEHDLDTLVLAAIPEYPDATEYHGLMLFEQSILVVDRRGYVDDDLMVISANIAHEYGHQVRGNRVTVSTWAELAVKEGLTVMAQNDFRSHQFGPSSRVLDVVDLRRLQFPEEVTIGAPVVQPDGGDPKRLYTRTTYLKGAEIFRMMRTVVGESTWWDAMRTFYRRHDLGAVGVDDFVAHLCEASPGNADRVQAVARWFRQAGRPHLEFSVSHDSENVEVTVTRRDSIGDQPCMAMPITLGFLSADGQPVRVRGNDGVDDSEHTVMLENRTCTYRFASSQDDGGIAVVAPLRGYSAPVDVTTDHSLGELGIVAAHDPDPYARWWAIEQLKIAAIDARRAGDDSVGSMAVAQSVAAVRRALSDHVSPVFASQALATPDEFALGDRDAVIDVDEVASGLSYLRSELGSSLADDVLQMVRRITTSDGRGMSANDIAARMPLEPAFALLVASGNRDALEVVEESMKSTNNTVALRAFAQLAHLEEIDIDSLSGELCERWSGAPRLIDRWVRARAASRRSDTVEWVERFVASPMYDRNDRARVTAVWFPFCTRNRSVFHSTSGRGYEVFVNELEHLMPTNSGLAVRFVGDLLQFQRFDPTRTALMRAQLERMTTMHGMPDFAVSILHSLLGSA